MTELHLHINAWLFGRDRSNQEWMYRNGHREEERVCLVRTLKIKHPPVTCKSCFNGSYECNYTLASTNSIANVSTQNISSNSILVIEPIALKRQIRVSYRIFSLGGGGGGGGDVDACKG